jgi:23S rRNA (adenine1618-N6)-methyltransferase
LNSIDLKDLEKTKTALHPRNAHRERYDFPSLISTQPDLGKFVSENKYGDLSIDFADPNAVKELNRALLKHFYKIPEWNIPDGYLCPPIPGRADYLHYLADLISQSNSGRLPNGEKIKVLDIGVGANCIYPMLGNSIYDWQFIGSEIDEKALDAAQDNLYANPQFRGKITLRLQENSNEILTGIIKSDDVFDLVACNPPFHESQAAAEASSTRKVKNLHGKVGKKVTLNFGGKNNELWCEGGELAFIQKMIRESITFKFNCFWFTSIVSKEEHLKELVLALKKARVADRKIIQMTQGNKKSRFIAWTFLNSEQQENWRKRRWK